jgi:hypothetical protein
MKENYKLILLLCTVLILLSSCSKQWRRKGEKGKVWKLPWWVHSNNKLLKLIFYSSTNRPTTHHVFERRKRERDGDWMATFSKKGEYFVGYFFLPPCPYILWELDGDPFVFQRLENLNN